MWEHMTRCELENIFGFPQEKIYKQNACQTTHNHVMFKVSNWKWDPCLYENWNPPSSVLSPIMPSLDHTISPYTHDISTYPLLSHATWFLVLSSYLPYDLLRAAIFYTITSFVNTQLWHDKGYKWVGYPQKMQNSNLNPLNISTIRTRLYNTCTRPKP